MIQCVHGFLSSALFKKVGGTPCRLFSTNVFFLLYKSHTVLLAYYYYYTKKLLIFSALYERLLPLLILQSDKHGPLCYATILLVLHVIAGF